MKNNPVDCSVKSCVQNFNFVNQLLHLVKIKFNDVKKECRILSMSFEYLPRVLVFLLVSVVKLLLYYQLFFSFALLCFAGCLIVGRQFI